MLSSSIWTSSDPYEYGKSVRAAEVKAFVTTRGELAARRTRIDLHHLWMQRCDTSLPHITYFVADEHRWAAMSLPPEDLAAAGQALTGRPLAAPRVTRVIRPKPTLMSRLMNLHKAAAGLAATAPDILAHPEVAKAMEQELVRTMVACLTEADAGR